MPFVRFSRDKRGYEYMYLFQEPTGRGNSSRPRVLYWYRTPPGVKVGREPFDTQVRQALEAQNPDLSFDWKSITQAQAPPSSEAEPWRERRRAERSAKQARIVDAEVPPDSAAQPEIARETGQSPASPTAELTPASPAGSRGRRRRRGGRRNRGDAGALPTQGSIEAGGPAEAEPQVSPQHAEAEPQVGPEHAEAEQALGPDAQEGRETAGSGNPDDETEVPARTS